MGQYNLLSYFSKEKPMGFRGILKLLKINQKLVKQPYAAYRQVPEDLKEWLVMYSRKDGAMLNKKDVRALEFRRGNGAASLMFSPFEEDETIMSLCSVIEFQQTIIVWHIATELFYHLDHDYFTQNEIRGETVVLNRKMSKRISRYMMYLLAISPETLPASGAIGHINFKRTFEESMKEIASFESKLDDKVGTERERKHKIKIEASKWLYERHKDLITNRDQIVQQLSGSLLSSGCMLAKDLIKSMQDEPEEEVIT
jgi:hypothetical protein